MVVAVVLNQTMAVVPGQEYFYLPFGGWQTEKIFVRLFEAMEPPAQPLTALVLDPRCLYHATGTLFMLAKFERPQRLWR